MDTQSKPLNIFFFAMDGIGHLNACVGLGQQLVKQKHTVTFLVNEGYKDKFAKFGFKEILLKKNLDEKKDGEEEKPPVNPIKEISKVLISSGFLGPKSALQKMKDQLASGMDIFKDAITTLPKFNEQIEKAIEEGKPDVFIVDSFVIPPAILKMKFWVYLCSAQPLCVFPKNKDGLRILPPYGAGFPTNSKPSDWEEYMPVWKEYRYKVFGGKFQEELNAMFNYKLDYEINDGETLMVNSPHLTVYGYPEELDYADVYPIPSHFARLDAFMRQIPESFELPKEVVEMPGDKLIYLSLGSMGSVDIDLMKRITSMLAKKPQYKCIVSKGPRADEYELPANCWGESFLPQTKILPYVDLVITHGGNNTVTESLTFGKPLVVMPLFGDQLDGAQRIQEKGYGIRLEPYTFTESELFEAIDKLLNDDQVQQRLKAISERMANSNSKEIVCKRIEEIAANYRE